MFSLRTTFCSFWAPPSANFEQHLLLILSTTVSLFWAPPLAKSEDHLLSLWAPPSAPSEYHLQHTIIFPQLSIYQQSISSLSAVSQQSFSSLLLFSFWELRSQSSGACWYKSFTFLKPSKYLVSCWCQNSCNNMLWSDYSVPCSIIERVAMQML